MVILRLFFLAAAHNFVKYGHDMQAFTHVVGLMWNKKNMPNSSTEGVHLYLYVMLSAHCRMKYLPSACHLLKMLLLMSGRVCSRTFSWSTHSLSIWSSFDAGNIGGLALLLIEQKMKLRVLPHFEETDVVSQDRSCKSSNILRSHTHGLLQKSPDGGSLSIIKWSAKHLKSLKS